MTLCPNCGKEPQVILDHIENYHHQDIVTGAVAECSCGVRGPYYNMPHLKGNVSPSYADIKAARDEAERLWDNLMSRFKTLTEIELE